MLAILDAGLAALRAGDEDTALMALKAATDVAEKLPKKQSVIGLPDQTKAAE